MSPVPPGDAVTSTGQQTRRTSDRPAPGQDQPRRPAGNDRTGGRTSRRGRTDPRRSSARPSSEAKRARRRGLTRLGVLVLVLLGVGGLLYLLLASSVVGVRSVAVEGTSVLSEQQVRDAAAIPPGTPMLRLDTDAVAGRVAELAPVAEVTVLRSWPSTVVLQVSERNAIAFEPTPAGSRLIDSGGRFFATVPGPPPVGLPELRAAEGAPAQAAAAVVTSLAAAPALCAELIAVTAESPNDVRLTLHGDRTVRWGGVEDSARKAEVLAVLLTQEGSVYDVASPDLPTIR